MTPSDNTAYCKFIAALCAGLYALTRREPVTEAQLVNMTLAVRDLRMALTDRLTKEN